MLKKIFVMILILLSFVFGDDEYQFGQGYKLGDTPLYLGGYFSARYDINENENEFDLDDIALLLYGSFEKFDFLSEIEASDVTFEKEGKGDIDLDNSTLHIERLYLTIPIKDDSSIYFGKFNTEIGFWNQTPINVLHDTTTPPHIMTDLFPKLTTGLGYINNLNDEFSISLAVQHNHDIDDEYNNLFVKQHYNFSIKNTKELYTWGIGGGYFKERNNHSSTYATVGIQKELENWSVLGELYSRFTDDAPSVPYDIYLQGTWHLKNKHDLILRAESYNDEIENSSDNVGLVGYTYRPYPFMALKAEYEAHRIDRLSHAVFSFSVIF
jgi:hypothetical protein